MRIRLDGIFVISLERATARRASAMRELARLRRPLPIQIWPAVDGYALDVVNDWPAELDADAPRFSKLRDMHPKRGGTLGFCLSNIRLLQHIQRLGLEWAMVLEDDFAFRKPRRFKGVLEVQDGAEIVSLDKRMALRGCGTLGMIYSRAAVNKILESLPLIDALDIWIARHCYGVIGGRMRKPGGPRTIALDTVSYGGPDRQKRLIKPSDVGATSTAALVAAEPVPPDGDPQTFVCDVCQAECVVQPGPDEICYDLAATEGSQWSFGVNDDGEPVAVCACARAPIAFEPVLEVVGVGFG